MPIRTYYTADIPSFVHDDTERILGVLTGEHRHSLDEQQRWAWLQQISILKSAFFERPDGRIFLEFYIPRMGKRADAVLILENIVFVIEFKVGASCCHGRVNNPRYGRLKNPQFGPSPGMLIREGQDAATGGFYGDTEAAS